ncbi:hypothetical protein LJC32_01415 [Oscillospiraceae bacterium OttesenSCG-928-F05]|nr:hypothetical protein [Oscillospiraceae bacterium OttesenSCG-928-F05]
MTMQEQLHDLITNPKQPDLLQWAARAESFLKKTENLDRQAKICLRDIRAFQDNAAINRYSEFLALLTQLYNDTYNTIVPPKQNKPKQIFVAMRFIDATDSPIYDDVLVPIIKSLGYEPMRIDKKQHDNLIINEIEQEIADSSILIADLTGNRGGVYYEAGIAKGLQLCNHPIRLILISRDEPKDVHFDLSGYNIIFYKNATDLTEKLIARLNSTQD